MPEWIGRTAADGVPETLGELDEGARDIGQADADHARTVHGGIQDSHRDRENAATVTAGQKDAAQA